MSSLPPTTESAPPPAGRSLDDRMTARAEAVLARHSQKRGLARILPFLGPAVIASIAYMDPEIGRAHV